MVIVYTSCMSSIADQEKRAMQIFDSASSADGGFVPGQAITIALLCQKEHLDPLDLFALITNNISIVPELVQRANDRHKELGIPVVVDQTEMERILTEDFNLATRLMRLQREELLRLKEESRMLKRRGLTNNQRAPIVYQDIEIALQTSRRA